MANGADPLLTDPYLGPGNRSQVDALNSILMLGGGALAAGAGVRGISGLSNFLSRNMGGETRTPMRQSFVRIPVPVKVRTPEERDALLMAAEQDKEAGLAKLAQDAKTTVLDSAGLLRHPGQTPGLMHNLFGGWDESSIFQKPWAYPPMGAAALGGLYGGWKLTDYLLDKTKNVEQESELEAARKDYEEALASRRKVASADPAPLDALADLYEKRALMNEGLGLTLLGLGSIAGLSGTGAYNWTRSVAEDKAVEEAVKRRQAQIAEQSPSPVMAIPTPVPIMAHGKSPLDDLAGQGQSRLDDLMDRGEAKFHELAGQGKAKIQDLAGYGQSRLEDLAGYGQSKMQDLAGYGQSKMQDLMGHGRQLVGRGQRLLGYPSEKDEKREKQEKLANIGQAADQFLSRIRSNQMAVWQRLMTPADGKPAKPPAGSDKPAPPQLPTLAGTRSQLATASPR